MNVIIMIGLQASGKSSFCQLQFQNHQVISKDHFPNAKKPQKRMMRLIHEALAAETSVVIDNTNVSIEDRAPIIEAARSAGAMVEGYYMESKGEDCIKRNETRPKKVPLIGILATVKRFQFPSLEEGFDKLFHVRMSDADRFEVTSWLDMRSKL